MDKQRRRQFAKLGLVFCVFFVLLLYGFALLSERLERHAPRVFGSTYMTMNNPYFTALNESIRSVVEANGDILLTRDPAQDQKRQNEQIMEMIDEGMSVLFANAADWSEIEPALAACREAGVAVFVVDTKAGAGDGVVSVIESDNYHAGELIAEDMMKKLPQGGEIVMMYHKSVYSTVERRQGFLDRISGHPEYRIAAETDNTSEIEVATAEMNRLIREGASFQAVFANNDPTAQGALAGIQMNRLSGRMLIYGVDGSPDVKQMIQNGLITGTVVQYPVKIGRIAAETAYEYLDGEEVPPEILVDVQMATAGNLNEFERTGWQ